MKKNDLTGGKYGRLLILKPNGKLKYGQSLWECKCDCGNIKTFIGSNIVRGLVKSCGCINKDVVSKRSTVHGLSGHPLYGVWANMKTRCYNKKCRAYKYYGGRGIKICEKWLDFISFYNDVSNGYEEGLTIDRIDNNGDYAPENYRWTTLSEQSRNTSRNIFIIYDGIKKTQSELSRELGITQHYIIYWLRKGLSIESIANKSKLKTLQNA